jgi:pimeloyl-ACP methyl ester carboxylesterase
MPSRHRAKSGLPRLTGRARLGRVGVRRPAAVAMVAVAAVALLTGGPSARGGAPVAATLNSRLLAVADLPVGWSPVPLATSSLQNAGSTCTAKLSGWTLATEAFVEGTSVPALSEALGRGAQARESWHQLNTAMAGCRRTTFVYDGKKVVATVRRAALPRLGAASSDYQWAFRLDGVQIGSDLALFHTAQYYGYLAFDDVGSPLASTVAAFARAAAVKAATGATAPVPDNVSIASTPVRTVYTALGDVAYRSVGSGPPLVMVNGWSATMEDWDPLLVDALAQHYRVITFDNAGIGGTESLPAPLTIDEMADQTSALIDALHLGRANVLGWSMGTTVAQALAVLDPNHLHRLVLCAPYPGNGQTVLPPNKVLYGTTGTDDLFPANQAGAEDAYHIAISSYPEVPPAPEATDTAQLAAVQQWWAGTDPVGQLTGKIAVPTLLADGADDRLDPATNTRALGRLIRGARVRFYPDAGHAFLYQDYSSFAMTVAAFLGHTGPR